MCDGSAGPAMYWNGVVARTSEARPIATLPYRPRPESKKTNGTNRPSIVVEYFVPKPIPIQPNGGVRSNMEYRFELMGAARADIWRDARRGSQPLCSFS